MATAQLAAAMPEVGFDVRVRTEGRLDDDHWTVQVRWHDGPERRDVADVLDGPPSGVQLVRHIWLPELRPEGPAER